jgi:hypothetical protein
LMYWSNVIPSAKRAGVTTLFLGFTMILLADGWPAVQERGSSAL